MLCPQHTTVASVLNPQLWNVPELTEENTSDGGALMRIIDSVSDVVGGSTDNGREFTEFSSRLHIAWEGNVLTLFRLGELMAYNEAEKAIYRGCAPDEPAT